jgi:putative dimethyl sulfoxide reductase chaperone
MVLVEVLEGRRRFVEFLRFLFWGPLDEEAFEDIYRNGSLPELAEMSEGGRLLQAFFQQPNDGKRQRQHLLQQEREEYERLFCGPGPLAAPLWESVYRSREHLLFDETTFQVREHYHRFGLQFSKENNEPDDHLLIELEFLQFLMTSSLLEIEKHIVPDSAGRRNDKSLSYTDAFQELLDAQIAFLSEHLAVWIPRLTQQIYENTESKLYRGAAALLNDFINDDLTLLLELKEGRTHA